MRLTPCQLQQRSSMEGASRPQPAPPSRTRSGESSRQATTRAAAPTVEAGKEAASPQAAAAEPEVSIRRRRPEGLPQGSCGEMKFVVPQTKESEPRNILEEIVWWKAQEVEDMRYRIPVQRLLDRMRSAPPPRDFIGALRAAEKAKGRPGLIAEVKKASPSRGVIQPDFDAVRIAKAYEAGGAACLSVLTDARYFQGSFDFLTAIRAAGVACPLLCKEFVVEAYQLFRARVAGADAVLLIAAVLPNADLAYMLKTCAKVGLQALVEVHTEAELERVLRLDLSNAMLGINNRDLGTFEVRLETTQAIMASAAGREVRRRGLLMAGESGIFTPAHVAVAQEAGCGAILVGESLVREGDPVAAVKALLA